MYQTIAKQEIKEEEKKINETIHWSEMFANDRFPSDRQSIKFDNKIISK